MKLPEGFHGYAIAKVCKLYNSYSYDVNKMLCQLNEANRIKIYVVVSENINIGGWKHIYMYNDDIDICTVYDDGDDLYESIDTNAKNNCVYIIKILEIIK